MADEITDVYIATEAGDAGWQSLSALAAEQVDVKLPIESEDGTVTLDSPSSNTFTVSTGGQERVRVQADGKVGVCSTAKGMGTISGGLKVGTDSSIGLQNVVYGKNANSYGCFVGVNLDMPSATEFVAYKSQQPNNYAGPDASVSKYVDFKSTNVTEFVKEQYGFYSDVGSRNDTDGSPLKRFQFYASTTAPSYFGGDIQTSRIVGAAAPDSDASIELGANLTVSTGGSQSVIVTDDGRVGFGATPASSVKFQNTGSAVTGMRSDITHNSGTRYQNSDGQLMVSTAAATSDIAVMSGFRIVGRSNAGATVDQYWGIYAAEVPTLAVAAGGVRTTINGDGADEGKASVNGFFNVYADGNAPNYFGGEVRITPTQNLNCSKIVGATAPDSDASIELGAELLTTHHTPTKPNSIATKKTVDDKIWVGTTSQYQQISPKLPGTLYCLTD